MTTIAANRECIAADSRYTEDGNYGTCKKAGRIGNGWVMGFAGSLDSGLALLKYLKKAARMGINPVDALGVVSTTPKVGSDFSCILLNTEAGKLLVWEGGLVCIPVLDKFAAIGSGSNAALGALHMGATPAQAVRIAAKIDYSTGGRITTWKY